MARKVVNGMKSSYILILTLSERNGFNYVKGINTETGEVLDELLCVSKKPLQIGAVNTMYIFNDVLRCNYTTVLSPTETGNQRIENILNAFEVVKERYEEQKNDLQEKVLYKSFTVPFVQMLGAIQNILDNDIKPKKKDAFITRLDNICDDVTIFFDELKKDDPQEAKDHLEIMKTETDNLVSEMHKLDLTWDAVSTGRPSLSFYDQLAKENLTTEDLLNVKPKLEKDQEKPKNGKKTIQKTLFEFE